MANKLKVCFNKVMLKKRIGIQDSSSLKSGAGFSLIELTIVIAVLAVMTAVLIVLVNPAAQLQKSRDAQRKADIRQIQSALEIYRADLGTYPASLPACGTPLTGGTPVSTYMQKVPCDPRNTGQYIYTYIPTLVSGAYSIYSIYSCLENVTDTQKDSTNNATYCTGSTTNWSYTVSNP